MSPREPDSPVNPRLSRRYFIKLGAAGASAFTVGPLLGCGGSSPQQAASSGGGSGGTLRVAYGSVPVSSHPHETTSSIEIAITSTYTEDLLGVTEDQEVVGVLAEEFEQVDDTTLRIKLRDGITFSDGRPLEAEDLATTFKDYLRPDSIGGSISYFWLDDVEVVDRLTVHLKAKSPTRIMVPLAASESSVIPRDATDPEKYRENPIGSGPYVFKEYVPNNRLVLARNDKYWNGEPAFDEIVFRQIPDDGTRIAALEAGEIDYADNIPVDAIDRLKAAGFEIPNPLSGRMSYVWFNDNMDGPWKDVRVRRAFNYAIDRDGLNESLFKGLAKPAKAPCADTVPHVADDLTPYPYDPDQARALLAEAGYPDGFEGKFLATEGRITQDRLLAEAITGQLAEVGVKLQLTALDWPTYIKEAVENKAKNKEWGLLLGSWAVWFPDIEAGMQIFSSTVANNHGNYKRPKFEQLLAQSRRPQSEESLAKVMREMQQMVWYDDPAAMAILEIPLLKAYSKDLKGVRINPADYTFWGEISRA